MCLKEIKKTYKIKDNKCGWGYKILRQRTASSGAVFSGAQFQGNLHAFKENRWLHEKKYRYISHIKYLRTQSYPNKSLKYSYGFHILLTNKKKLLEKMEYQWQKDYFHSNFKIVRVKYRYAQTMGIDQSYKSFTTLVAKEIFIVSGKKGEY